MLLITWNPLRNNDHKLEIKRNKCKVVRDVEGDSEVIETSLPLLVPAQQGLNEPRYPSLPGIMKAKKKPLEQLELDDLDLRGRCSELKQKQLKFFFLLKKKQEELLEGNWLTSKRTCSVSFSREAKVI